MRRSFACGFECQRVLESRKRNGDVLKALEVIKREAGPENVQISSDFHGSAASELSRQPDSSVHERTRRSHHSGLSQGGHAARRGFARKASPAVSSKNCPVRRVSFEAADIVSQVMGFGSPTPVEVAVMGTNLQDDYAYAQKIQQQVAKLPFLRDLQFAQELNYPTMDININRERAGQFGLTMADVVRSVVPATSSSRFTQPNYWVDPNAGPGISDSGATSAEPDSEHRCAWQLCRS